ncbi:type III polyketide synthase [Roseimaritima sediminicola]|uniref:type III polyketide synthase n=1 Tax=Roseimaritima sediminicola TaxID=2662066 RepID=UPI0012984EC9|nr:type III polyketide synthase [Roseimaritima sediminicola]
MNCAIVGLGTALPRLTISQQESLTLTQDVVCEDERQRRLVAVLYRRSGVRNRHIVVPWQTGYEWSRMNPESGRGAGTALRMQTFAQHAPPLAESACRQALEQAGAGGGEITHLVTISCTGFVSPGIDAHLIDALDLPPTVERVQVGFMGCHGAINGIRVAQGLLAANPGATVLLCAVELCSLHYRMNWDEEAIVGNALFADGAAALVLRGSEGGHAVVRDTASCWIPDSAEQMSWQVGDHGFDMRLSAEIPGSIEQHLAPFIERWIGEHGLSLSDVGDWIVHPGGPKILDAAEHALALSSDRLEPSREVLRECGNMSSPTVLFILQRLLDRSSESKRPRVILGFGPGLVAEAVLLM